MTNTITKRIIKFNGWLTEVTKTKDGAGLPIEYRIIAKRQKGYTNLWDYLGIEKVLRP